MDPHVYKNIELTGTSTIGLEDAIQNAVSKAAQTVRHMRWFEVVDTRGTIEENSVVYWQVTIKIGFHLE
jgi:flavin-binding protein dodecin